MEIVQGCVLGSTARYHSAEREALLETALKASVMSLQCNDNNHCAHKWYAITNQDYASMQGTKEKVLASHEFREHTMRALEICGSDATLHYMLGMFCFQIAKSGWVTRRAAAALAGKGLYKATFDEALDHFHRAIDFRSEGNRADARHRKVPH